MTRIAYWSIWQNADRLAIFPFADKAFAEVALAKAKETANKPENIFLQMIKLPLSVLPCSILCVYGENRRVGGASEDKYGDVHAWSKTFRDVTVVTTVLDKHELYETFTSHIHKGEVKVTGHKDFYAYAKERWPIDYPKVMREINLIWS